MPGSADQPQIRLVHERGGLKRVTDTFASQIRGRPSAQLLIDQRHELVARGGVPAPPCLEEIAYVPAWTVLGGHALLRCGASLPWSVESVSKFLLSSRVPRLEGRHGEWDGLDDGDGGS